MKKITFLSLVSLSLTVAATAAVQNHNQNDDSVCTLPSYNVSTARLTDAEKTIEQSLAAFRTQARAAQPVRTELESIGVIAKQVAAETAREVAAKPQSTPAARS